MIPATLADGEMAATLVGHSPSLLQFAGGANVLTNPIWSEHASPVSFAGPRRARPPAIAFEELPPVGLVLVSHGHYDHRDLPTLRRLEKRFSPVFPAGSNQGALLRRQGLRRVEELDWWLGMTGTERPRSQASNTSGPPRRPVPCPPRRSRGRSVSSDVGYESPSQFSREYRRLFGAPPGRDAARAHRALSLRKGGLAAR